MHSASFAPIPPAPGGIVLQTSGTPRTWALHQHGLGKCKMKWRSITLDLARIETLKTLTANWNGYDAAAPNQAAIDHALRWATEQNERIPDIPDPTFVNLDAWGDVSMEWRPDRRRNLSIFIDVEHVSYLKAWGPNVREQMADGDVESQEQIDALFTWLKGNIDGSEAQQDA